MQAADEHGIYAGVISASETAPAYSYIGTQLQQCLQTQLALFKGSPVAFQAAIATLDAAWKRSHPYHGSILEGVQGISIAYMDADRQTAYLASHGSCRAAAGRVQADQQATVTASQQPSATRAVFAVETIPITDVSCIIVGSSGLWCACVFVTVMLCCPASLHKLLKDHEILHTMFRAQCALGRNAIVHLLLCWFLLVLLACASSSYDCPLMFASQCRREVGPAKAVCRLQTLSQLPSDHQPDQAAHLINYALHAVTGRMRKLSDPRMRALSSVSALQSLWVGSQASYRGYRTPLRRKRGDVHGDLTAIVIQLQESGEASMCYEAASMAQRLSALLHDANIILNHHVMAY